MRYIQTLNGIWNFSFTGKNRPEQPFKTDHVMTVPGCFDLIEPFCGKRGYALYTRKVHASGLHLLEIDGAGISGEVFWDGEKSARSGMPICRNLLFSMPEIMENIHWPLY